MRNGVLTETSNMPPKLPKLPKVLLKPRKRVISDSSVVPQTISLTNKKYQHGSQLSLHSDADSEVDSSIAPFDLHQATRIGNVEEVEILLSHKKVKKDIDRPDEHYMAPLHYAARFDNYEIVQKLVENGADPCVRDKSQATPLHFAARKKENANLEAVKNVISYLAKHEKGDINAPDKYGSRPLHFAAMRGNDDVVETLLDNDANIDARDDFESTALHEAVTYNQFSVAKTLIERGAEVTVKDKESVTPLHLAATQGTLDMVRLLVETVRERTPEKEEQFINSLDVEQNTALHMAIESRNVPIVEYLVQEGAEINIVCRKKTSYSTPLHLAAVAGDVQTVKVLLEGKNEAANVHALDIFKATPLHKAAEYGSEEVAQLLLQQDGIEINARDDEMYTPLLTASCYENSKMVKELLKTGADAFCKDNQERSAALLAALHNMPDNLKVLLKHLSKSDASWLVNTTDRFGNSPLHVASRLGHSKVVDILLKYGANVYSKNEDEETSFHLAAMNGMVDVCKQLLGETDDKVLNDEDEDSNTALHLAAENGHLETVKILVTRGADKESRNCDQWTPLDFAASKGHVDVCEYLLEEDVPVNPIDRKQRTPLHLASSNGHVDVVTMLLEKGADVSERNDKGHNALDMAISRGHTDVAVAIVQSPIWRQALMSDSYQMKNRLFDEGKTTPLRRMIKKMPDVALQVLDRCIETGPEDANPETSDNYYICYNYELLDDTFSVWDRPTGIENEIFQEGLYDKDDNLPTVREGAKVYCASSTTLKMNHPMMMIAQYRQEALMSHPVTRSLLRRKWNIASFFYLFFLLFYALFLAMLSSYMMVSTPPFDIDYAECAKPNATYIKQDYQRVSTLAIFVLSAFGMIVEGFQLCVTKWKYMEPNNFLDWFSYISAILVVIDFTACGARTDWQWQLGAFSLLISWMDMMLFLRRLPWLGIYVIMVVEILKTFLKFFIVFFLFILAFAISFFILLQNQVAFSNPWYSIVKTWVMMIGEMDFTDIFHGSDPDVGKETMLYFSGSTYTIYIVFLVLIALIVMNLLTGLAVDDVNQLQNDSRLKKLTMQLELALDVEVAMPYFIQRLMKCVVQFERVFPNQRPNPVAKFMRRVMEGPLCKELVADEVLGRDLEEDREEVVKQLEVKLASKIEKNRSELKTLHQKVDNIESMVSLLLNQARKRAERRATRTTLQPLPDDGTDARDEETDG